MSRRFRNRLIIICITIFVLTNLQYLPFPESLAIYVGLLFLAIFSLCILSIFALPVVTIMWILAAIKKEHQQRVMATSFAWVIIVMILSVIFCLGPGEKLAVKYEIHRGNEMIKQIEAYKLQHGYYPDHNISKQLLPNLTFFEEKYTVTPNGYILKIILGAFGVTYYIYDPHKQYKKEKYVQYLKTIDGKWDCYFVQVD